MAKNAIVKAFIHSLEKTADPWRDVELIEYDSINKIVVKYDGKLCTAINNPWVGIMVDDIYGILPDIPSPKGE